MFLAENKARVIHPMFAPLLVMGLGVAFQAITMLGLARYFGPGDFGLYSVYLALITVAIEVAGLGSSDLMVRHVSADASLAPTWLSHSLTTGIATGAALSLLCSTALALWAPTAFAGLAIWPIVLIDLVSGRISLCIEQAFIALGKPLLANLARALVFGIRLIAAVTFIAFQSDRARNVESWLIAQAGCSLAACGVSLLAINGICGPLRPRFHAHEFGNGIALGAAQVLRILQQNSDRLVLGLVLPPVMLGQYAAASRLVLMSLMFVQTYLRVIVPGYYQAEMVQAGGALRFAKRIVPGAAVLSVVATIASIAALAVAEHVLGKQYDSVFWIGVGLTPQLILIAAQYVVGDVMAASRMGHERMWAGIATVPLSAAALYLAATWFGLLGVVISSNVILALNVMALLSFVLRKRRTMRTTTALA